MTFYLHFELATAFSFHYYSNCNSDGKTIDLRLKSENAKDYEEKENKREIGKISDPFER